MEKEAINLDVKVKRKVYAFPIIILAIMVVFTIIVVGYPTFMPEAYGNVTNLMEDANPIFTYNFSANVTALPSDLPLTFSIEGIKSSVFPSSTDPLNYPWIWINSSTGIMTLNATNDTQSVFYNISIHVVTPTIQGPTNIFYFNVTPVNDAPRFTNLANMTFNATQLFSYNLTVTDEENNFPYKINITFLNCTTAQWSDRQNVNCTLFNSGNYSFDSTSGSLNISFIPLRNDVGSYVINFTITDSGNTYLPYNASTSQVVNFTVSKINDIPYFRYVCDNERNATENSNFKCYINASDTDETNNLTYSANESWFTFNISRTSIVSIPTNITTQFNSSAMVNFTPQSSNVGNWSINVTLTDTGNPKGLNSTVFYFYVGYINHSVSLDSITNLTAYTSNNYTIYINATDDNLLIPDKRVYNESLIFSSNETGVNVSSLDIISGTNITTATLSVDPNLLGGGVHHVNISVHDANNYSVSSRIWNITVISNTPPQWNASIQTTYILTENTNFYLNLSANVTDPDAGQNITFSYSLDGISFADFDVNANTGVINFTPKDADVGEHLVTISATDGITPSSKAFNFTVYNVPEQPYILRPLTAANITVNSTNSFMNMTEDSAANITLIIQDDDFRIPDSQKRFYRENITLNAAIVGPNPTLLSFTTGTVPPGNSTTYTARFTPSRADTGNYTITLNVTDAYNYSDQIIFNLSITKIEHSPVLSKISNNTDLSILERFFVDFNATDIEDGSEPPSSTNFTYKLASLTSGGNFLTINATTGIINFTLSQAYAGLWSFNVSVNDTSGRADSQLFNITVYDYPKILSPSSITTFNLKENQSSSLSFSINHTIQTILNYSLYLRGELKNSTLGFGNASSFSLAFIPNFTDETDCTGQVSLTLNVSNVKLSNVTSWNITINHTNYPLTFSNLIGGPLQIITGGTPTKIFLSDYFTDPDTSDCNNQLVSFDYNLTYASGGAISVVVVNWTNSTVPSMTFTTTASGTANYSITAHEYNDSTDSVMLRNVSGNNFTVQLSISTVTVSVPSSGGGGNIITKPVSLKILMPGPVSSKKKDHLVLPIGLINNGRVDLNEIILESTIVKDGIERTDLKSTFDRSFIPLLKAGAQDNVTLIVDVDTQDGGMYEIDLNATVKNPAYKDWGKMYIQINEQESLKERIVFTEELVVGNPQCAEIKETVDSAKKLFDSGSFEQAQKKVDEAIAACQRAISQPPRLRTYEQFQSSLFSYVSITSIAAAVLGLGYYVYRRRKLRYQWGEA